MSIIGRTIEWKGQSENRVGVVNEKLTEINQRIIKRTEEHNSFLKELGLPII